MLGKRFDLGRHSCRKQHCLAVAWQVARNALDWRIKTKIKHVIGFIKNEMGNSAWVKCAAIHQIFKTARRGDNNIDTASQSANLCIISRPAKNGQMADIQISR